MNTQDFVTIDVNTNNNYILEYKSNIEKPIWNITMYYTKNGVYQSDFIDLNVMEYKHNFINLQPFNDIINTLEQQNICTFNIFSNDKDISINIIAI